uniref:RecQ mediated genome instability 2 n=1 Tax=Capra hircus TaxID=9925 RepID=A0A8C2RL69_CAPHI
MAAPTDSLSVSGTTAVRLPRSPPLKVLAEQLRRDAEGGPGSWRLSRAAAGREPLELTAVWMQGTVVEAGGGEARLRDPSGSFSVRGLERVPRGRPCLDPGNSRIRTLAALGLYRPKAGPGRPTSRSFAVLQQQHGGHQAPYPSFLLLPSQAPPKPF